MQHGGPGFKALQTAPSSTLLNRPALVAAYTVAEFRGSIASAVTGPPSGPSRVHTLAPAETISGRVAKKATNANDRNLRLFCSTPCRAASLLDFIVGLRRPR